MMIVCFDVDGTLIDESDQPIPEMVALAKALSKNPLTLVVVWSGGGIDYANMWADRLGLLDTWRRAKDRTVMVAGMGPSAPDIVIDDQAGWGRLQLIVKRGNSPVDLTTE